MTAKRARTAAGTIGALVAAVFAMGAGAVGCSGQTPASKDSLGQVALALTLSPSVTVNTVTYTVTGNGIMAIHGTLDVSNTTHAAALISGVPASSSPYTVSLHADSTDGKTRCDGFTTFTITAGGTATANVVLQCRGPGENTGVVAINGRFDNCPFINQYTVSALEARVGAAINIGVMATDYDAGDALTFAWTANPTGVGTFGSSSAASTTFTCTAVGTTSISISVSDGVCSDSRNPAIPMTCAAGGTGGVGGTTGAGGGGGSGAACAEPQSGGAACPQCTTDNCSLGASGTDGCCGLASPSDQMLCATAALCFAAHPCTTAGDPTVCFCGSAGSSCFTTAGAANGACTAQVIAAAKTSDPATIKSVFVSSASPLGRAVNVTGCRGSFCSTECGIP